MVGVDALSRFREVGNLTCVPALVSRKHAPHVKEVFIITRPFRVVEVRINAGCAHTLAAETVVSYGVWRTDPDGEESGLGGAWCLAVLNHLV